MIDIDYFKDFNDAYGHIQGDEALIEVASIIDNSFNRVGDLVARYGGEEFVVLVPNFDYDDAKAMADNLRQKIHDAGIENIGSTVSPYLTVSIGVATMVPKTKYPVNYIVDEADSALYLAKKSGRNIVKGIQV
jgi:diguanylate cyclase (GGDEF)-like protein